MFQGPPKTAAALDVARNSRLRALRKNQEKINAKTLWGAVPPHSRGHLSITVHPSPSVDIYLVIAGSTFPLKTLMDTLDISGAQTPAAGYVRTARLLSFALAADGDLLESLASTISQTFFQLLLGPTLAPKHEGHHLHLTGGGDGELRAPAFLLLALGVVHASSFNSRVLHSTMLMRSYDS